jgi:TetR/AcrR family transcriptional regulator, cholesterol catabolism regulator
LTPGLASARPGMPGPPSAADARRAHIIGLAAELFDRGGYASVSMEQIAVAAGLAKPTLYHYFRSKEDILRGIHEAFIDPLLTRQEERRGLQLAPADQLLGAMTDILGLMETRRGYVRVFFEHYRELSGPVRREIRVKRNRYQQLVRDAVTQGIDDGTFRGVDPDVATMAVFGMCNWAYQWWRPGSGMDSALTAQELWDIVIRGLAAPARRQQ